MNILVIDTGTSSMRGILFTEHGLELISHQYFYNVSYLDNGWVEQNPADWRNALFHIVKNISKAALQNGWTIDALSLTSQRSSVIPVDSSITPLYNAIMWQDRRTAGICSEFSKQDEKVSELCGARVNPVFSGSKMTWIRRYRPDLYKKTYKFLVIPDYLIWLMTGNLCTDHTYGSRSLLMNLRTCQWDDGLLALFEVERQKLCSLVTPGSICGRTSKSFSAITGCPAGIPVVTAGGDQQCSAIGQGNFKEGTLSVTVGTGAFLITPLKAVPKALSRGLICNAASIPGTYVLETSLLTCCSAFDWFRENFYADDSYETIEDEIRKAPAGSNRCLCLPYFQGHSLSPQSHAAGGMFANLTLKTEKSDLLRSLLEGICCEIQNGIRALGQYTDISEITVGGGLSNCEPFNEILCNITGMELIRRGKADSSALGALAVALCSLGIFSSVEGAFQETSPVQSARHYKPDPALVQFYRQYQAEVNRLYRAVYGNLPNQ